MEQVFHHFISFIISFTEFTDGNLIFNDSLDSNWAFEKMVEGVNPLLEKIFLYYDWNLNPAPAIIYAFLTIVILIKIVHWSIKKWGAAIVAFIIFCLGILLYFIGFCWEGTAQSLVALGLRSVLSSIEMFWGKSNLLEVAVVCKKSPIYMTIFSIVHFSAILTSIIFTINRIYFYWIQWIKMPPQSNNDELYIFFDTNDSAWTLAMDIERVKERRCKIVFIDEPEEIEDKKERHGFIDLLGIRSFREQTQKRIETSKRVFHNSPLFVCSNKNISSFFTNDELCNMWTHLRLNIVFSLMRSKHVRNIHVFLFSDDTEDNLKAMQNINEWGRMTQFEKRIDIYCKARHNEKNAVHEERGYLANNGKALIHMHIVDDASLAVLNLKKEPNSQPIQYVQIDPKGSALVTSTFEAMILGFGQTGRDAFRFLYEYATFPGIQPQHNDDERSPILIHVYDQKIDVLKGRFLAKCPALLEDRNKNRYDFQPYDINSLVFWEGLKEFINRVNYVVIALGDDDTNITAAIDLYKFALRYRSNLNQKFDIYVRLYTLEKEKEFNMIKTFLCQEDIEKNTKNKQGLFSFGVKTSIYSYHTIIQQETLEKAQIFDYVYKGKYDMDKSYKDNTEEAKKCWEEQAKTTKTLADVWDCIRKEEQNMANCWHIPTKIRLIKSTNTPRLFDLTFTMTSKGYMKPKEALTPEELQVIRNVAKCEHLRWNSLSELQGYETYWGKEEEGNKKFIVKKKLSCLRPFENVPKGGMPWYSLATATNDELKDTINYDENTVYTSIICAKIKEY